ncbi:MAG: GNAT family N-acetyltransferase [Ruminococcaceae bacterium]|nr:GNAT family N-acetyltransferase [Oscillospiraceae bacterium]
MKIRFAAISDTDNLCKHDRHISKQELEASINMKRVYIAEEGDVFIGWLRYNLFWDNTPFMNMLYLLDGYRGKGNGKALVRHWENEMKALGFGTVMTSTASDEYAQHFYNRLGYAAIGGFTQEGEPYELILSKKI